MPPSRKGKIEPQMGSTFEGRTARCMGMARRYIGHVAAYIRDARLSLDVPSTTRVIMVDSLPVITQMRAPVGDR
jgi:hypothetical protein